MKALRNVVFELGLGVMEGSIKAARAELDKSFQKVNSR